MFRKCFLFGVFSFKKNCRVRKNKPVFESRSAPSVCALTFAGVFFLKLPLVGFNLVLWHPPIEVMDLWTLTKGRPVSLVSVDQHVVLVIVPWGICPPIADPSIELRGGHLPLCAFWRFASFRSGRWCGEARQHFALGPAFWSCPTCRHVDFCRLLFTLHFPGAIILFPGRVLAQHFLDCVMGPWDVRPPNSGAAHSLELSRIEDDGFHVQPVLEMGYVALSMWEYILHQPFDRSKMQRLWNFLLPVCKGFELLAFWAIDSRAVLSPDAWEIHAWRASRQQDGEGALRVDAVQELTELSQILSAKITSLLQVIVVGQ